ncbi:MAG: hypothetical protein ABSF38_09675 [Verrucomicrobiota bacterium]|jgi:hypothetical protein
MSYKVLVIPEDFTKDEHILKPLAERILQESGKPNAKVAVCRDPNFGGIGEALKTERLRQEVIARYPMVDLFILVVDRDGVAGRETALGQIEATLQGEFAGSGRRIVAGAAWQEVEVFILAGHDLPSDWSWQEIRADPDVKNTYFQRLAATKNTSQLPHQGRKKLMAQAIQNWGRIKSRCPEDIGSLLSRLATVA